MLVCPIHQKGINVDALIQLNSEINLIIIPQDHGDVSTKQCQVEMLEAIQVLRNATVWGIQISKCYEDVWSNFISVFGVLNILKALCRVEGS